MLLCLLCLEVHLPCLLAEAVSKLDVVIIGAS